MTSKPYWKGITTHIVGPTNHRPTRIRAKSPFYTKLYTWDDTLNVYDNHLAAARKLTYDMAIGRPTVQGGPEWDIVGARHPDGSGYMFILFDAPPA